MFKDVFGAESSRVWANDSESMAPSEASESGLKDIKEQFIFHIWSL